jgi:hypothetical protein
VFGVSREANRKQKTPGGGMTRCKGLLGRRRSVSSASTMTRVQPNIEGYKVVKRVAKRAMSVAKGQAYDGLYQRLGMKEGGRTFIG